MEPEIYEQMMSTSPVISEKYLHHRLGLQDTQSISTIEICQVVESNTAITMKLAILITEDNRSDYTRRLFIKTAKPTIGIDVYNKHGLKEVQFYRLIRSVAAVHVPIVHCLDAYISEDQSKYLLLLEDMSNVAVAPTNEDLDDQRVWLSAAASLARLHAAFWNPIGNGWGGPSPDSREKINSYIDDTYTCCKKFIDYVGNRFDAESLTIYEHAVRIEVARQNERYERTRRNDNVTLVHGDSHIHNFMLPHEHSDLPTIVDFQFWGVGIGTGDVAHLTRVSFPDQFRQTLHRPIVERYYETLLTQGVFGYSWENCWNDYRKSIVDMLFIPVWQYSSFNLKYDEWMPGVVSAIANYKALKCEDLEA